MGESIAGVPQGSILGPLLIIVQERVLRIVYDDYNSSYSKFLITKIEHTIH